MDDAPLVRRLQAGGNLNRNIEQLIEREGLRRLGALRAASQVITQGLPFQQLHHDEGLPFVLAEFVDGANIGMVQRRGSARLAFKTLQRLGIVAQFFRQELQRYAPGPA